MKHKFGRGQRVVYVKEYNGYGNYRPVIGEKGTVRERYNGSSRVKFDLAPEDNYGIWVPFENLASPNKPVIVIKR